MNISKKTKNYYKINNLKNIFINNPYIPYDIEEYNNKKIINIFLEKNNNISLNLENIEKKILNMFDVDLNYISPIKYNNKYLIIRCFVDKYFNISNNMNIILIFDGIWVYKDTFGLKIFATIFN